ncbi:MAG: DmsE family decaheme c-type cytochrome [Acidobacteriota bacterium]|nr:DmsE family decaheme c-type cytochrome [Acidobacteriota bacterium]
MRQLPRTITKYFLLVAVVAFLTTCGASLATAQTQTQTQTLTQGTAAAAPANGFVGDDTCATCHQETADGMANNPHHKLALKHGGTGATCESCHGAGQAHVDGGGDVTKIVRFDKLTPTEVDKTCLGCHANTHPNFLRSPHAKAGVSCLSCHSIHKSVPDTTLLVATQPKLCYQCHTDIKPSFAMPFHHKVNEGLVKCSDCHDVHGTFNNNNLKLTADQNLICTKCHSEVRGPFVYEHPPVKAEGCVACHTPHGSQNARLLNMPNINTLCNQCHSLVGADNVHGQGQGSSDSVPCTSCHTYIHGSNLNAAFLR